ncbi:MAG: hypothetical protein ACFFBD_18810 [Candidatus Hodarchaeota archaeon]
MSENERELTKEEEEDLKLRGLMVSKGGKEAESKKAVDALLTALEEEDEE